MLNTTDWPNPITPKDPAEMCPKCANNISGHHNGRCAWCLDYIEFETEEDSRVKHIPL